MVLPGDRLPQEADAGGLGLLAAVLLGGDDRDPVAGDLQVAQDQRQDALPDGPETDDDDAAGDVCVLGGMDQSGDLL
jgi:hypothetical protein